MQQTSASHMQQTSACTGVSQELAAGHERNQVWAGSPFSAADTPRAALSPLVERQSSVNSERPAVASVNSTSSTRSQVAKV